MSAEKKNLPASVQARLKNLARDTNRPYDELLHYFAIERFLYRMSRSDHADRFVLKGALVIYAWDLPGGRPTRDIDLRCFMDGGLAYLLEAVRAICVQPVVEDGIVFDPQTVRGEVVQEQAQVPGAQVLFEAFLGRSRVPMRLDVNFSDVIVPEATTVGYPALLDMPAPRLRAYPLQAIVAEKLHAAVVLGEINSRMKDFYDLWLLSRAQQFDGNELAKALVATFERRATPLPRTPLAAFGEEWLDAKRDLWTAFVRRLPPGHHAPEDLGELMSVVAQFVDPPLNATASGEGFEKQWPAGGPWRWENQSE